MRIEDHALIGDGRSCALVDRGGTIDWLCWPRFDSDAFFAALLDPRAGRWTIRPRGSARVTRRYVGDSNVLETTFETSDGTVSITDAMIVGARAPAPEHWLVRRVECLRGAVEMELTFEPRPHWGLKRFRVRDAQEHGVRVEAHGALFALRGEVPLTVQHDAGAVASFAMRAGERRRFGLVYAGTAPATLPLLGAACDEALDHTIAWWQEWARPARRQARARNWPDAVVRSALVLKLLAYAPSGAIVAAPTTSLPERIGGDLNWDYRFCWLRDASFTTRAFLTLGYFEEASMFVSWLLHATWHVRPGLDVLYDVFGRRPGPERELPLQGYEGSRPVRVGNAAAGQTQLDVYGDVVDATYRVVERGLEPDRDMCRMLDGIGRVVSERWRERDSGIWEVRGAPREHTSSRVACWTALDRLVSLVARGHLRRKHVDRFARERDLVCEDVKERGWNSHLGSYTSVLGGDDVDASLLRIPYQRFEPADSPRMRGTWRAIEARLGTGRRGWLLRYRGGADAVDGAPANEGAFIACGFWAADLLARAGRFDDARAWIGGALESANDVGLMAEEADPASGGALGNFPQAYSHVAIVNAVRSLEEKEDERRELAGVGIRGDGRAHDPDVEQPRDRPHAGEPPVSPGAGLHSET